MTNWLSLLNGSNFWELSLGSACDSITLTKVTRKFNLHCKRTYMYLQSTCYYHTPEYCTLTSVIFILNISQHFFIFIIIFHIILLQYWSESKLRLNGRVQVTWTQTHGPWTRTQGPWTRTRTHAPWTRTRTYIIFTSFKWIIQFHKYWPKWLNKWLMSFSTKSFFIKFDTTNGFSDSFPEQKN